MECKNNRNKVDINILFILCIILSNIRKNITDAEWDSVREIKKITVKNIKIRKNKKNINIKLKMGNSFGFIKDNIDF